MERPGFLNTFPKTFEDKKMTTKKDAQEIACDVFIEEWSGTEIETGSAADCCDAWVVGERRCKCGNRRMYVDAILLEDGTYLTFPMAD